MAPSEHAGWRAMTARGYANLSPPEAEHAILELATDRAEYAGVLEEIGGYPARSPIGLRVPSDSDVAALKERAGRWRGVVLLEDERALRAAGWLFNRVFVLDPFYDSGALLYAAWHDRAIRDEHSRRLAEQTGLLVRAAPMLNAGTAVLAPDHLPGSWNPRPGWQKPRATEDRRQLAAWAMRCALVLVYWADRLDAVVCATRTDVVAALDVVLGARSASITVEFAEAGRVDEAQLERESCGRELTELWADLRTLSRRRGRNGLEDVAFVLNGRTGTLASASLRAWRLSLGQTSVPEPATLIRRVLSGEDPEREPPLPRKRIRRRPLCLVPV